MDISSETKNSATEVIFAAIPKRRTIQLQLTW